MKSGRLATTAALAWLVMLAGCANLQTLPFLAPAAPAASAAAAAPEVPAYELDVEAPAPLRKLLLNYLDLARFRSAPSTDNITAAELDRLILAAPAQAQGLLETEGYFNADVSVARVPGVAASGLPLVRMTVTAGLPARVSSVQVNVTGALQSAALAGEADALAEREALRGDWPLPAGAVFRQAAWADAKNAAITRLRSQGYAGANWARTNARVDAQSDAVAITVEADSGPLFRIGAIRIEGLQRYEADAVLRLAYFDPGERYTERRLLDFQERLQKVGLFEGASVELDADPQTAAAAPVRVRVKEQPLQQATLGVGYSANTGARLSLEHTHRAVFGTRWVAKNKFELGPDKQAWEGELLSHPLEGLYRNLLSGSATNLRAADETLLSWNARVGRTQDTPRIERLYFAELTQAKLKSDTLTSNAEALSINYQWVYRDVDNVLLPTRGLTTSAQAALGVARGTREAPAAARRDERGPFSRLYARMTWYRPLGGAWFGTLRAEAGQLFTRSVVGVPDTLLFRAGGDDSVRGYAYRTLGPATDGVVTGGRSLATASIELARPLLTQYPALWGAAFIDAGDAADRFAALRPALGYGLGLRWRSPVGPLRVDVAYGQREHRVRLHFGVGIAF